VHAGRWRRIADLLHDASDGHSIGSAIAEVSTDFLGVDHASLTFIVAGQAVSTVGNSDEAAELCRLQFELGEGPAVQAFHSGTPVLIDDLNDPSAIARAPLFIPFARDRGVGAMFAFPLRVGAALVGVMTAHRALPGPLDAEQYADGLIVSTLATIGLLQVEAGAAVGTIEVRFEPGTGLHAVVQVAAGMVSEQLGISVVEALVRMRAHAFSTDVPLDEVARDIVERRLRLER
jgi:GAF domain-containing protein